MNQKQTESGIDDAAVLRQMQMADRIIARDTRDNSLHLLWSKVESELNELVPSWDAIFPFSDQPGYARLQGLVHRLKRQHETASGA